MDYNTTGDLINNTLIQQPAYCPIVRDNTTPTTWNAILLFVEAGGTGGFQCWARAKNSTFLSVSMYRDTVGTRYKTINWSGLPPPPAYGTNTAYAINCNAPPSSKIIMYTVTEN